MNPLPPIALAAAALLVGCAHSTSTLNNELVIGSGSKAPGVGGGQYTVPSLTRAFNTPVDPEDEGPRPAKPAEKSVWGISRDNWEVLTIPVPNDRPEHQPIYTRSIHETTEPFRDRGRYPTASSALDMKSDLGDDQQILEAAEAPFAALADVVLFLPRAVWTPPWTTTRTGFEPYRRAPDMRGSIHPLKVAPTRTEKPDPTAPPVHVPIGDYPPVDGRR